ncbi:hypothetical protein NQ318_005942 [Aromia moschata]|uniref:Hypoxia up-regulated protein 1 n=1 Tax=Aromia moschata TaxID=1265417 RepID=A0AAV8YE35_9CUCU|nr:hypothetical protein NQ318_005942 [Aromia moschata]
MKLYVLTAALVTCFTWATLVESLAVMSVDLGSEWMKIGIVSPGVPMEIALNKESKRKTPAVISFRDNIRLFGEDAQSVGGKSINHPLVKLYQERFPYYNIVENQETGTIIFRHDEHNSYSPEELIAQLLAKAKEFAENGAHQPIKECVLTVPGFFNQVERRALLQAANLADLKRITETAQYVMFYDMGASSTTATLVSYQTIKTKERGYVETHPQASILGVGYDRTLGGLEIQLRLRDYLAKKFNEMKKTKNNVFENPRAMAKLFKEAGRLKNVLSANAEHHAQIEGLLDEQDFKLVVKREEMEELIKDLLDRVGKPVETALKTAHLTMDVVSQVVLVGAGTRVPKVQEYLQKSVQRELAKNLNTDEAATLGAVYKAADLSTGFKVSKFITKDAVVLPIQVMFERETDEGLKQVRRTLFGLMNPYPQKKIITFNKHTDDFSFSVNYADLDYLPSNEILNIGMTNLSEYKLTGVAEALKKNTGDNIETKGIKAHFAMDDSGLLNMVNVELVVEKTIVPSDEEEGTLSKLGSTFSKLFGGEDEKPVEKPEKEKPVEEAADDKPAEKEKDTEKKAENTKDSAEKPKNTTSTKDATEKEAPKETKPKVVTVKEPIKVTEEVLTINLLSNKQFAEASEKLQKLDQIEKEINRRATALNNLESFVIDVQNKLDENEYAQAATKEDIEKIRSMCQEISDWLYDEGSEADADTYEKKLDMLQGLTKELFSRVWEHKEAPEALNALNSMLNHSSHFLLNAKNLTKSTNPEKDVFTDVEVETLGKLIDETIDWRDKIVKEQKALKKSDPPKLTVKLLMDKMAALDREVKYLVNKIKMWKPKKVEKPVTEKVEKDTSDKNTNETSEQETIVDEEATVNEETIEAPEGGDDSKIDPAATENSEDSHTEL